jgi:hypothetical protein
MVEHTTERGDPYWANTFPMGRVCLEPVAARVWDEGALSL